MKLSIKKFCERHGACYEGREWAVAHCRTMEQVWARAKPEWVVWIATRHGVLTDQKLREFALRCARQVQHLMADPRSVAALDTVEAYISGRATAEQLSDALEAARSVVRSATRPGAARSATWAANAARSETARLAATWASAWAEWEMATAKIKQAQWLRENCVPNFNA
jgi:hypothetical protein